MISYLSKAKNRNFLILGSTGFIGSNLVETLVNLGAHVHSYSRSPIKQNNRNISHTVGDIMDKKRLEMALKSRPDVIINLVGYSGQVRSNRHEMESLTINALSHIKLLQRVRTQCPKAKVIFSSSRLEYGKISKLPVNEDHPASPLSFYGLHKHFATEYSLYISKYFGLDTVAIRSSNPFGPHPERYPSSYNILNSFIDLANGNKPITIYGRGHQIRDYIFIGDLVDAFVACSVSPNTKGKVYNLGSGKGTRVIDAAKLILNLLGKGAIKHIPWPREEKQVETGDYIADIKKIIRDTKWTPHVSLKKGLEITIRNL